MPSRAVIPLFAAFVLAAGPAGADGLLDRVEGAAKKAGDAIEGVAKRAGEAVEGTVELATDSATPAETRARLDAMAGRTLDRLFAGQPAARGLFEKSAGYAVFDARKVSLGVSAGFGRGVAVPRPAGRRVYMNFGTGGVGLSIGFGGFEHQIVILFETAAAFDAFVTNGYDATAEAGTMFGDEKAGETLRFDQDRSIFVLTRKGWKLAVSAAGTKYWPDADLN